MNDLFSLKDKNILITGSSQGIGYLLAQGYGVNGAKVIINGSREEKVFAAVEELQSMGINCCASVFDVTQSEQVDSAIDKLIHGLGHIDVLVNNAGIQRRHPFTEFPEQDWNDVIAVNQTGVFLVSKKIAAHMKDRQAGKIINICSMQSELGRDTITPYAASKGAVKMMTRGMCVELARYNIQVNGIAPGYFKTDMTQKLVDDKEFTAWLENRTPAHRWGDPKELIGAAIFLASNASNFVNGHLLFVDGGMLAAV